MARATAELNKIGLRYVQALLDVCQAQGATESVAADLAALAQTAEKQADFYAFLRNPLLSAVQQDATILDIAKKMKLHAVTLNFLRTLVSNGRLHVLPEIMMLFPRELSRRDGVLKADVTSAYPLSAAQEKDIATALTSALGSKVMLNVSVDKTLLGGLTIRVGSVVIDDSVAGKLQRLRRGLTAAANAN